MSAGTIADRRGEEATDSMVLIERAGSQQAHGWGQDYGSARGDIDIDIY